MIFNVTIYPVKSFMLLSIVLVSCTFDTKQNALGHFLVKSKIHTVTKYIAKCNVFCVTYSGVFFCHVGLQL